MAYLSAFLLTASSKEQSFLIDFILKTAKRKLPLHDLLIVKATALSATRLTLVYWFCQVLFFWTQIFEIFIEFTIICIFWIYKKYCVILVLKA